MILLLFAFKIETSHFRADFHHFSPKKLHSVIDYCNTIDGVSTNLVDINMLDIDYAYIGCTLHCIYNEFDITIFYDDIFNAQSEKYAQY